MFLDKLNTIIMRKLILQMQRQNKNKKLKTIPQIQPAKLAHSPFARVF